MSFLARRRGLSIATVLFVLSLSTACGVISKKEPDAVTRVTLTAATADGRPPTSDQMESARTILAQRLSGAGFDKPQVMLDGDSQIVISVSGRHVTDEFVSLVAIAHVRFRKVLNMTDGGGGGKPAASSTSVAVSLEQVKAKLGQAMTAAQALTAPANDPTTLAALAPFAQLTPAEVAMLPPGIQFNVPQIGCANLNARLPGAIQDVSRQAVACQDNTKFLLDAAKLGEGDFAGALPLREPMIGQWVVTLKFTSSGQQKWTSLTREAFNNDVDPKCAPEAVGDQRHCLVAIVRDNAVISAPEIQAVLTGDAQIMGGFDEKAAKTLASQVKGGGLPIAFTIKDVTVIEPRK